MKSILRRSDRESKQQGNKIATQNCQSRDPTETYLMRCFQYANPISIFSESQTKRDCVLLSNS